MEQGIKEKEGKQEDDVLSSIDSIQRNILSVKSRLERELIKKERMHKETLDNARIAVDRLTLEYNKNLSLKDKEVEKVKSSVKDLIEKYEEIIKEKEKVRSSVNPPEDSKHHLQNENIFPNKLYMLTKDDLVFRLLGIAKENMLLTKRNEFLKQKSKESFQKIKDEYNKHMLEKDKEFAELKSSVNELIKKYEKEINSKEERIKLLSADAEEENSIMDTSGMPKSITSLSKTELLTKLSGIVKENLILTRALDDMKKREIKREEDYLTSKAAFEGSFEEISGKFIGLQDKNEKMEDELLLFMEKLESLSKRQEREKEFYEKKNLQLISYYESRINELVEKSAKEKMHAELSINMLQKEIEEHKKRYAYKEEKKEEFIREIEQRIKDTVRAKASEFITDYDTQKTEQKVPLLSTNLNELSDSIKSALEKGDTKEKIIFDLKNAGFNETEILNAYKNIKK